MTNHWHLAPDGGATDTHTDAANEPTQHGARERGKAPTAASPVQPCVVQASNTQTLLTQRPDAEQTRTTNCTGK